MKKAIFSIVVCGFLSLCFIISAAGLQIPEGFTFNKTLYYGIIDPDVAILKNVLNFEGCFSGTINNNFFGIKTKAAVKCFQLKYQDDISEIAGYTIRATGVLGAATREYLNSIIIPVQTGGGDEDVDITNNKYIKLTSPNGGESLQNGQIYNIKWTSQGINQIMVEVVTEDRLMGWHLAYDLPASQGYYAWNINDFPAGKYRIHIWDPHPAAGASTYDDYSDNYFTIASSTQYKINVLFPNGGETLETNAFYIAKWESSNIPASSTVKILLRNSSDKTDYPLVSTVNDGNERIDIPANLPVGQYMLHIKATVGDTSTVIYDWSDSYFKIVNNSIVPSVTVISPNGGETWQRGTTQTIKWSAANFPTSSRVYIDYKNYYSGVSGTIGVAAPTTGYYSWSIPSTLADGQYYVRIYKANQDGYVSSGETVKDVSDNAFTIAGATMSCTDSDSGKDYYAYGFTTFKSDILSNDVVTKDSCVISLGYDSNGQVSGYYSANSCSGDNCYISEAYCDTTTPDADATQLMKCSNGCENGACKRTTQSSITVLSPNGGEGLTTGQNYTIKWSSTNIPTTENVKIELAYRHSDTTYPGGLNFEDMITMKTPNTGSYTWNVQEFYGLGIIQGSFSIKISYGSVVDYSDTNFSIKMGVSNPSLTVSGPVAGVVYEAGDKIAVKWTPYVSSHSYGANLLRKNDPSFTRWLTIIPDYNTPGLFHWKVLPGLSGADYYLRIGTSSDAVRSNVGYSPVFRISDTSTLTCTDSDGGGVYYVKGTAKSSDATGSVSFEDQCNPYNSNQLYEAVCTSDKRAVTETYTCPNGCENGVCINPPVKIGDAYGGEADKDALTIGWPYIMYWDPSSFSTNASLTVTISNSLTGRQCTPGYVQNSGRYAFTLPSNFSNGTCSVTGLSGSGYKVKLSAGGVSISSGTISILSGSQEPIITIVSPMANTNWTFGTPQTIEWHAINAPGNAGIFVTRASDGWACFLGQVPASAGSTTVTPVAGQSCPNQNMTLSAGNYYLSILYPFVSYTNAGASYGDGFGQSIPITLVASSCKTFWWYDNTHRTCQQEQFCGEFAREGLYTFATQAECQSSLNTSQNITVTSPNGGETWGIYQKYPITWRSTGLPSGTAVNIYLYSNNYTGAYPIATGISASSGSYSWLIPTDIMNYIYAATYSTDLSHLKIRVTTSDGKISDYSDTYFKIGSSNPASFMDSLSQFFQAIGNLLGM